MRITITFLRLLSSSDPSIGWLVQMVLTLIIPNRKRKYDHQLVQWQQDRYTKNSTDGGRMDGQKKAKEKYHAVPWPAKLWQELHSKKHLRHHIMPSIRNFRRRKQLLRTRKCNRKSLHLAGRTVLQRWISGYVQNSYGRFNHQCQSQRHASNRTGTHSTDDNCKHQAMVQHKVRTSWIIRSTMPHIRMQEIVDRTHAPSTVTQIWKL